MMLALPFEIWRDVVGYEGFYQVSNMGNVVSLMFSGGKRRRLLKQGTDKLGYKHVVFQINNVRKLFKVHRLVGLHFVKNTIGLPIINHIDSKRDNNVSTNLERCNNSHNQVHSFKNNGRTGLRGINNSKSKRVSCTNSKGDIFIFNSMGEVTRELSIKRGSVHAACTGRVKSTGGFILKFI